MEILKINPRIANIMPDLAQEFNKQKEILRWLDSREKLPIPSNERSDICLICYDLAIEHHAAILLLYDAGLCGSMFALLRIQFEAQVRGQYFQFCASEKELVRFRKDKDIGKNFGEMISATEKKISDDLKVLSNFKKKSYSFLNSFTHSGYQHLTRRMDEGGKVGAVNYSDQEVLQVLQASGSFALLAYTGVASLGGDKNFMEEYHQKCAELS
jgi:hypothetical protein